MSNTTTATKAKERPILLSGPMIRAIMEGRKTQTRRIIKPQPSESWMKNVLLHHPDGIMHDRQGKQKFWISGGSERDEIRCPYGEPGDILWVRETWQITDFLHPSDENFGYIYRASENGQEWEGSDKEWKWKPSIHMPKAASRIWLQVEEVRVQRLGDITEEDAIAEGVEVIPCRELESGELVTRYRDYSKADPHHPKARYFHSPGASFRSLWTAINGSCNPATWVWAVTFRVLSTTGKPLDL